MDKIDLIYDICKKSMDEIDEVSKEVSAIKQNTDLNTRDLREHMRRSLANENRLKIMEDRFTLGWFVKTISTVVIGISAFIAAVASIIGYL